MLRKFIVGLVTVLLFAAASLWVTSWALEPEPHGVAFAPDPAAHPEPLIQVYGADVWGWRGNFAIHTWIATKAQDARAYRIYQVIGWRLRRNGTAVSIGPGDPDRQWFGSPAILLHELRGDDAGELIDEIHDAALRYPFAREYTMWPGPNSNSFTAWIALEVPGLGLELPVKALGRGWMKQNYASHKASAD